MNPSRGRLSVYSVIPMILAVLMLAVSGMGPAKAAGKDDAADSSSKTQVSEISGFSTNQPLILIVDISGSMEDLDSTGVQKLAAAKKAMNQLIRSHAGRSVLGLWTYPGEANYDDSGCPAGGWVGLQSPDNSPDATEVSASINALIAGGGTPTGPAIDQAVKSLRAKGFDSATLVLVSDGESNCGPDPCEVAKQLASSGFDLQVASIGFDISGAGQSELQCIANATGGTYADVEESSKLIDELGKYLTKPVEVQVSAPTRIRSGGNAEFQVKVTNPSNEEVRGLTAVIAMDAGSSRQIFPQVLAPQKKLPVLSPGASAEIWWTATAATGKAGDASWRVLVGSETDGAVLTTGTIKVTDEPLDLSDAGPLLQKLKGPIVVLGDSYSSGEGAGDYIGGDKEVCHRSLWSYGGVLGGADTEMIACSGAITRNLRYTSQTGTSRPQADALAHPSPPPGAVVLTSGGNDIGFANIVKQCYLGTCRQGEGSLLEAGKLLKGINAPLADAYKEIIWRANTPEALKTRGGQIAPLIVSPYPDLFWEPSRGKCNGSFGDITPAALAAAIAFSFPGFQAPLTVGAAAGALWSAGLGFDPQEIRAGKEILGKLNSNIRSTVAAVAAEGYPIYFADDVVDFAQPNHTICGADPYFVPLDLSDAIERNVNDALSSALSASSNRGKELAHPNRDGYQAWADAIVEWTQTSRAVPLTKLPAGFGPTPMAPVQKALTLPTFRAQTDILVDWRHGATGQIENLNQPLFLRPGGSLNVRSEGHLGSTNVNITMHSTPLALASLAVDDQGVAEGIVQLPADLETGKHQLVVSGLDTSASPVEAIYDVFVRSAIPVWFWIVIGVGAAALAGGLSVLTIGLMRIRSRKSAGADA